MKKGFISVLVAVGERMILRLVWIDVRGTLVRSERTSSRFQERPGKRKI